MQKIIPNLWISDGKIEEAVDFYCSLFEGSSITSSGDYGPEAGDRAGPNMSIYFELLDQPYAAINGADTRFDANESLSLAVPCDSQEEIDRLWDALVEGGAGSVWLAQGPLRLQLADLPEPARQDDGRPRPEKVKRVMACFMAIDKRAFDIDKLQAAFDGR